MSFSLFIQRLCSVFAFFEELEIRLTCHLCRAHISKNNVLVNAGVGGDNDCPNDSIFDVCAVRTFLTMETKPSFYKNALKYFPVNWGYAWHANLQSPDTEKGIGTVINL